MAWGFESPPEHYKELNNLSLLLYARDFFFTERDSGVPITKLLLGLLQHKIRVSLYVCVVRGMSSSRPIQHLHIN